MYRDSAARSRWLDEGSFTHGGWGAPYAQAIHDEVTADGPPSASAYLFGRRTYEKMAQCWPHQTQQ